MESPVALFFLLAVSPLMLLVMVLVKLTSKGPVFFIQRRAGHKGKIIKVPKIRTYTIDGSEITPIGKILRRTTLDELLQLWLIFKRQMVFIGPRPLTIEDLGHRHDEVAKRVYKVKPGLMSAMSGILGTEKGGIKKHENCKGLSLDAWMAVEEHDISQRSEEWIFRVVFTTIWAVFFDKKGLLKRSQILNLDINNFPDLKRFLLHRGLLSDDIL